MKGKDPKELLQLLKHDGGGVRKKPPVLIIWLIIAAVAFLAFTDFGGGKKNNAEDADKKENQSGQESAADPNEYAAQMEQRLTEALKKINGAGTVSVFINIDSGGERILASDKKSKEETEERKDESAENRYETEESIVLSGQGTGQSPYVVEELLPKPAGVLVVAEGAKDEKIKCEIYEAVRAVFGLAAHRIKVTY